MTTWVPITVTVPEWAAAQVLTFAAELTSQGVPQVPADLSDEDVSDIYDQATGLWLTMLETLARETLTPETANRGGWVPWERLCEAMAIDRRAASGVLGSAHKRLKGVMPFEKEQIGDSHRFRMPLRIAQIITDLATDQGKQADTPDAPDA
jgi:hypothetical protein